MTDNLKKYEPILTEICNTKIGEYVVMLDDLLTKEEMKKHKERIEKLIEKKLSDGISSMELLKEGYFHLRVFIAILIMINVASEP